MIPPRNLKPGVNPGVLEGKEVPAPLMNMIWHENRIEYQFT
jgi:hypothetical protein